MPWKSETNPENKTPKAYLYISGKKKQILNKPKNQNFYTNLKKYIVINYYL